MFGGAALGRRGSWGSEEGDWMDGEGGDHTSHYSAEPARSGRSTCVGCGAKIAMGALRIGHHYSVHHMYGHDGLNTDWRHPGCQRRPPVEHLDAAARLRGFARLKGSHKEELRDWFARVAGGAAAVVAAAAGPALASTRVGGDDNTTKETSRAASKKGKKKVMVAAATAASARVGKTSSEGAAEAAAEEVVFELQRLAPGEVDSAGATLPTPTIRISSAGPDVQVLRGVVKPMAAHTLVFSSRSTHGTFKATASGGAGGGGRLQLLGRESKLGYGVAVDGGAMVADGAEVVLAEGSTVALLQHNDPERLPLPPELVKYQYRVVGPLAPAARPGKRRKRDPGPGSADATA